MIKKRLLMQAVKSYKSINLSIQKYYQESYVGWAATGQKKLTSNKSKLFGLKKAGICASAVEKNLGFGCNFPPCSESHFLTA